MSLLTRFCRCWLCVCRPMPPKLVSAHVWDKDAVGKDFLGFAEMYVG